MNLTNKQAWPRAISWLRKEFPTIHPVSVRSIELKDFCGDAILTYSDEDRPIRFFIRINKHKNFETRIDTLLHEWAHCLSWLGAGHNKDHGSEWGIAYARIYRKFLEWDFRKKKT